ncbi:FAD-dependent oxidoreductase [Novosphingobium sp.]|uniref:flavin monoamine oxidase family protein n=1 Tax=Novosphingobium sp. TaxID=1874826 RepID=UPI0031D57A50
MGLDRRGFTLGLGAAGLLAGSPALARGVRSAKPARGLDVIVLGAGISGLNTACLLEQQGLRVAVIEGRQRVGGRIMTLLDQPGYPEMGFNSMAAGYGRGIDAAKRAGVELVDVAPRYRIGPPPALYINGKPLNREEWARHPANPFPEAMKSMMPAEVVSVLVARNTPLKDWTQWADAANAPLDVSLHAFLSAQGLSEAAIRLANDVSPYYGTNAHDVSALMLEFNDGFVKAQATAGPQSLAVKGGNLLLPQAMARQLKGDVMLGREVVAIDTTATGATVTCADGASFSAGRVVCSLPFSTLRLVSITPGLTGVQARGVTTMPYQPLSIAFLTATAPFWEEDGIAPGMWTDGTVGTVMPQRFGATDQAITGFTVQARGALAHYWDAMGKDGALAYVIAGIEAMRPAARGKLRGVAYFSWVGERFNLGDWAYFSPGQVAGVMGEIAKPVGRLHFCGEHTATGARGLEGALESSERVALEVLSA